MVNAGSSSLKLRVLDGEDVVATADEELADAGPIEELVESFLAGRGGAADAVGHRVVHLAPLHNAPALRVPVLVVHAREDLEIASQTRTVVARD